MTKIMLFSIVIFLVMVISAPIFAGSKAGKTSGQTKSFAVENPNHVQVLGGKSTHAQKGLQNASEHSDAIVPQNTKEDPKDSDDSGDSAGTSDKTGTK